MKSLGMADEIIEKNLKRYLVDGRHFRFLTENDSIARENTKRMHGTTILALKYNKGVIIAADRRCVAGETIFSDREIKIEEIGNLSCLAAAGWVSDSQQLTDILKNSIIPELEKFLETKIFVDGQANLLKEIMRRALFLTWPILAGFDPFKKEGAIFFFEPGGAEYDLPHFVATGSGGADARGILEKEWSKNCSQEEGISVAIEALLAASGADRNTSPSSIRAPLIKLISSEKIADVSAKEAFETAWKIIIKEEARKGLKDGVGTLIGKVALKENSRGEKGERK
jgi:20S proteasome alpha/beta subunit